MDDLLRTEEIRRDQDKCTWYDSQFSRHLELDRHLSKKLTSRGVRKEGCLYCGPANKDETPEAHARMAWRMCPTTRNTCQKMGEIFL